MASRNAGTSPAEQGVVLTNPITPGRSEGGGGSRSASQFSGIDSPEALGILLNYIHQTFSGGTEEQRRQRAERNTEITRTRNLSGDYTKASAFKDAAELMAQNLRISLEKNMPMISKSIQGAGTSASSMQGLLSTKLATESAQAASALGAEQAKAYGQISTQLQGVLEALTRIDPSIETNLLKALELTKVGRSNETSVTNPTVSTTQSGGGSFFQPIAQPDNGGGAFDFSSNVGRRSVVGGGPSGGFWLNEDTGAGEIFRNNSFEPFPTNNAPPIMSELDQQYADGWGYGD